MAVAFGIAAVAAACGRKALPRPPQWVIPESPAPLEVTTVDDGIKLSWRRPTKYVDGRSLDDLGRFDVERACLGFPFEKVAELDVDDRARFRRNRAFAWIDRSPQPAEPCHYRVTAWTLDGYGSAPAESWLGAPSPTPAPSPTASPDGTAPAPSAAPSPDPKSALPAPLASPTPEIPPAPAHAH
ncbi:MAG: hypothetical protein ACKPBU_04010 [Alphaproteobacteria bacterium]